MMTNEEINSLSAAAQSSLSKYILDLGKANDEALKIHVNHVSAVDSQGVTRLTMLALLQEVEARWTRLRAVQHRAPEPSVN